MVTLKRNQGNDDATNGDCFWENPLWSAAPDSGLVEPTMRATSMERSPVDRLLLDPPSGKSIGIFGVEP